MNRWQRERFLDVMRKRDAERKRVKGNKHRTKEYLEIMKENAEWARKYFEDKEKEEDGK